MTKNKDDRCPYHVALSFAGEDREYVEAVASNLEQRGVKVFYDSYEKSNLWGKNLYDHLVDIYGHKSHFVVMFISKHYKKNVWPNHERQAAQARAYKENREYILPVRFDKTVIPGMLDTTAYIDQRKTKTYELADLICKKLNDSGILEFDISNRVPRGGKVRWAPVDACRPGIKFIAADSGVESLVPWFELQDEIRNKLLTQVDQTPEVYSLELNTFKGKQNWRIRISDESNRIVGHIWFGPDPENDWKHDGLVRVGSPHGKDVWQTFERYTNGTYVRI